VALSGEPEHSLVLLRAGSNAFLLSNTSYF
jgi:hypothetical protein